MIKNVWRGAVALVLGLTAGACGTAEADGSDEAANSEAFVRVINVEVTTLEPETFVEDIRLTSAVMANQDVMVSAEENGVIRTLFVDKGARVNEGDPIAQIDDGVLSAQVDQARAQADLAAQIWERRKILWEDDRVGSEIAYLEAKFAAEQTAASLDVLEQRLARTTIRAPFSGVLDLRLVEVGSLVSPGDAVGRLVDMNPVRVMAGVPERYATDVAVGNQAVLTFDVLGDEVFTAPIRYVGSTVDPASRTFLIEVQLRNPGARIKPEMVANMAITRQEIEGALVVPQDALVRVEDGYVVFVAEERDGTYYASVRIVELGATRRNLVVLASGVAAGERLVVVGQKSIADGDQLNIVGERD